MISRYVFLFIGMVAVVTIPVTTPYLVRDFSRNAQKRADASAKTRLIKEAEDPSAALKKDRLDGFTRIDADSGAVDVYRDNKSGCEWVAVKDAPLTLRTAPDKDGIMRPVCPSVAVTGLATQ